MLNAILPARNCFIFCRHARSPAARLALSLARSLLARQDAAATFSFVAAFSNLSALADTRNYLWLSTRSRADAALRTEEKVDVQSAAAVVVAGGRCCYRPLLLLLLLLLREKGWAESDGRKERMTGADRSAGFHGDGRGQGLGWPRGINRSVRYYRTVDHCPGRGRAQLQRAPDDRRPE